MNRKLRFFLVTIQLTLFVSVILVISAVIIYYVTLPSTLDIINPPPPTPLPPCPYLPKGEAPTEPCDPHASFSMFPPGTFHNFGESIFYSLFLFFLTVCAVGFGLGFYLKRWKLYSQPHIWQALLGGLISGSISYAIFIFIFERRNYDMTGYLMSSIFCILPAALTALIGYYVAGWRKISNSSELT